MGLNIADIESKIKKELDKLAASLIIYRDLYEKAAYEDNRTNLSIYSTKIKNTDDTIEILQSLLSVRYKPDVNAEMLNLIRGYKNYIVKLDETQLLAGMSILSFEDYRNLKLE